MLNRDLSGEIIAAAIKVHRKLGPGLLESAYESCLAFELEALGMKVERWSGRRLFRWSMRLSDSIANSELIFIVGCIVAELKCKDALHPVDEAQLLSHLRLLGLPVGLLINFHVVLLKHGIKRMVNNCIEPAEEIHTRVKSF